MNTNTNTDKSRDGEREERQLVWTINVLHMAKTLNAMGPTEHVVNELVKAATQAYVRHGERGTLDFFQQIKSRCQTTWEARRWLLVARRADMAPPGALDELIDEADILMRMDFSAIRTMEMKRGGGGAPGRSFEAPPAGADDDVPFEGWRPSGAAAAEGKAPVAAARGRRPAGR